jgi:membrane protein implicated in regulation of membrane protease activity
MMEIFWACLVGGSVFALVTALGGHLFHRLHGLHHSLRFPGVRFLHPTSIIGAVTAFGGAGILLVRYTALEPVPLIAMAVCIAVLMSVAVHFAYVKPVSNSESSIGFSRAEYVGRSGLITVGVPDGGYGQVMIRMGAANTCQIAASFDCNEVPKGTTVVVVEIHDGVLYVSPIDVH